MNEFLGKRVAVGSFTIPTNVTAASASTLNCPTGVYLPAGAIVTGIRYMPGAITGAGTLANMTLNPSVGGQLIGTADRIATQALVNTVAAVHVLSATAGVRLSVGGELAVGFGSTVSNRSAGSIAPALIYVEYIYAN